MDGTIEVRVQLDERAYRNLYQHLIEAHGFAPSNVPLWPQPPGGYPPVVPSVDYGGD